MKVTWTVPATRDGQTVEVSVTRADDGPLEFFVPPCARKASAVFEMTPEELAKLALGACPPPVSTLPGKATSVLEGQLALTASPEAAASAVAKPARRRRVRRESEVS